MAAPGNLHAVGILLSSTDRDRLIAWYRSALEPLGARWEEHLLAIGDGMYLGFDKRDDVAPRSAEPGRHMVNFSVRDIRAAERHLNSLGVRWVRPVEETDFGFWFSTVEDPDGNYVQFIQMKDEQD
ncbi:VOC family protein [Streptomyces ovatisporus]|uniref:VOC family protein n=1 Tax=Streptomyces ovatisporus TaxID=1128682 RepID=A0ABV9A649_9ACTN